MPGDAVQLWIGTYAKPGGKGLSPLRLSADGSLTPAGNPAPPANASFGVYSAAHDIHYLVDECDSRIGAWRRLGGEWRLLATVPAHGKEPCYLALDISAGRLAVANYASGSLALFALGDDGVPASSPGTFQDSGTGPVKGRQEGPHDHCVRFAPAGDALYAVDLGADQVLRLGLEGARLGSCGVAYRAPAGSGPRHLLFHPERPFALLLSELASTLTLFEVGGTALEPRLRPIARCSTLPSGWHGANLGGHLEWPRGERAYVSNRGHDSVALIEVDLDRGLLAVRQHVPSGGRSPRHFRLLDTMLVVAHEKDGAVTSLSLSDDGSLTPSGQRAIVRGACFVFRDRGTREEGRDP
jgi:6-phosphogluconolactonase